MERSCSIWQGETELEDLQEPVIVRPTMAELFASIELNTHQAGLHGELQNFSPTLLRAIYVACLPISDADLDLSKPADQELRQEALTFVSRWQPLLLQVTLAELVLVTMARSLFYL